MNPELLRLFKDLLEYPGVKQESIDSITGALGLPHLPVRTTNTRGGGAYTPSRDAIVLDYGVEDPLSVFSHELTHERSAEMYMDDTPNDQLSDNLSQIFSLFEDKFTKQISPMQSLRHVQGYYGDDFEDRLPEGMTTDAFIRALRATPRLRREYHEVLANTMQRGYDLARRADPQDPSKVRKALRDADSTYPGTMEAFNFWMRSFINGGG